MFRQRTSSAKPGDELLANFRQQFPEVAAVSTSTTAPAISQTTVAENPIVQAPPQPERVHSIAQDLFRDQDPTPRATNDQWRFTPSLLDPNSLSFNTFANAPPGYYTPTPGGTNTLFHPQAGDLHTPTLSLSMGLGTPLSMPTSGDGMHPGPAGVVDMAAFQTLHPHHFHHFNPFIQAAPPQPTFAPSTFVHQDTGYETMDQDNSQVGSGSDVPEEPMPSISSAFQNQAPAIALPVQFPGSQRSQPPLPASAEKFRFHATLNAPTAMIKHADEIPITYLNKGQAYTITINDTNGVVPIVPGTKYRTFIRISFEDDQQRQRPGVCWGLWKEGRGTSEAHQRGGKLQAVEFVEAGQPAEGDDKKTRIELESSSFDGFSVIWTPGANGATDVGIAVRFNFLSTDFSHSKGVKGIPVRLCTKTSLIAPESSLPASDVAPEICFCKVKLFRDHGAERKLSNDVSHVKKSIDKLKQQIAQAESGMKDFGKRKRSTVAKAGDMHRPGKVIKHKRTWSMSSASSAGGGRGSAEDDLHFKLQSLQDMFTSTRPISVLFLRGEEHDDPDLHPVSLPGDISPGTKIEAREGPNWQARSGHSSMTGSMISPSPSSLSLASQASALGHSNQWQNFDSATGGDTSRKGSDQPTKINKGGDDGNLSGWIEALGVDPSYRPPLERGPKPIACFYVIRHNHQEPEHKEYHRAVYLMERTLKELTIRIASKWGIDPSQVIRTIHTTQNGLEVELDDDVVRELKEGQDMTLDIEETQQSSAIKQEWEMAIDSSDGSPDTESSDRVAGGFILRLTF